jgi:hypothetical protein
VTIEAMVVDATMTEAAGVMVVLVTMIAAGKVTEEVAREDTMTATEVVTTVTTVTVVVKEEEALIVTINPPATVAKVMVDAGAGRAEVKFSMVHVRKGSLPVSRIHSGSSSVRNAMSVYSSTSPRSRTRATALDQVIVSSSGSLLIGVTEGKLALAKSKFCRRVLCSSRKSWRAGSKV